MFDYLIVDGGLAGRVPASRLPADPAPRACLLETGAPGSRPFIRVPLAIIGLMMRMERIAGNTNARP